MNSVEIAGVEIMYEIRPSRRARRLGLTIYPGGRLVLTRPYESTLDVKPFIKRHGTWILRAMRRMSRKKRISGGKRDYQENRTKALALVQERLTHFNQHYGFNYRRVTVRYLRSRWGSCSRKGNLSFSYQIVHLDPDLQDYIVVHELCHLAVFNHSQTFWRRVHETVPRYKEARAKLRSIVH